MSKANTNIKHFSGMTIAALNSSPFTRKKKQLHNEG